ncbi:FAD-dependent monooxygenase [Streptomyces sp. NPDC050504]|uniref:FAD-dependent monooxygenase n=1 Tax=Streptomyces sp. NPDC050504 TaxID=3365618 RepID=UPI00379A6A51
MNHPVVIAGAGPVGLMLAGELALAGVPALVLDRRAEPGEQAPGMAVNSAVVELLAQRGIMDLLQGDGMEFPRAHFAHIWLDPEALAGAHPYTFLVPHHVVERRLEEYATKAGARVRRGAEVVGLRQDASGVELDVLHDGGIEVVRAAYAVGCDGADSAVRRLAGIGFPGADEAFYGLIGDLTVEADDPLFHQLGVHQHEKGFFTVGPVSPTVLRVTTGEFDAAPDSPGSAPSFAEFGAHVRHLTGAEPTTGGAPRWLSRWTAATRQAERYREGRVFLAGDAAHLHFPLGGQALSTGIEDAVNLGWKLATALRDEARADLLDSYHEERHPVGARACATTRAQMALLRPGGGAQPLRALLTELAGLDEVNRHLVALVGGLDVRYASLAGEGAHPLVGHRLPLTEVETGDGPVAVSLLLHAGHGVLLQLSPEGGLGDAVSGRPGRIDVVTGAPVDGLAAEGVLLRPDGRVAWAGPAADTAGLAAAADRWFGSEGSGPDQEQDQDQKQDKGQGQ